MGTAKEDKEHLKKLLETMGHKNVQMLSDVKIDYTFTCKECEQDKSYSYRQRIHPAFPDKDGIYTLHQLNACCHDCAVAACNEREALAVK